MQLTTCQHRLEHVPGVDGPFTLSGSDNGMQFVDKQQNLPLTVVDFLEDRLETFLKFTPVFGPGNQGTHIEGKNRLAFQAFGDVATNNPVSQTFNNGGFANSRFTNQHRVVLGLPGENANNPTDLFITTDDRVELTVLHLFNQVTAIFFQGFVGLFRVLAGDSLMAADLR